MQGLNSGPLNTITARPYIMSRNGLISINTVKFLRYIQGV